MKFNLTILKSEPSGLLIELVDLLQDQIFQETTGILLAFGHKQVHQRMFPGNHFSQCDLLYCNFVGMFTYSKQESSSFNLLRLSVNAN